MTERAYIAIRGAVQGVGFRPFIYRLATEMGLAGWVRNSPQGVSIEVEGSKSRLDGFVLRIEKERPPRSFIQSLEFSFLDPVGYSGFEIRRSENVGEATTLVLPDVATCSDCLREIFDPADRRHLYPFANCTHCGPRFTIIESLPYDRANTSMKGFEMCGDCRREHENPLDRRFHAQPNACPRCGPRLELWGERGDVSTTHHAALVGAAGAIRMGKIAAVKGLGGFHLLVDARNDAAVRRLRERKHREEKPLALMAPSLAAIQECCEISPLEERLLVSSESPIVLLRRKPRSRGAPLSPLVAPRNPYLGFMLPYTPLHHLLMRELNFPVVATSGNRSDEPICTDEHEAVQRLNGIADLFLVHDRPIVRHVDDSVARVMMGRELILRRARGYAPLPVRLKEPMPPLLAVGGQLKNAVAMTVGDQVFISQHIGDLETEEAFQAFQKVIESFRTLYGVRPQRVVCDLHPEYLSAKYARERGPALAAVQHHHAHVASCMAENGIEGRVLGVAWDGTGYGSDGTIWGGEFLLSDAATFSRVGSLRRFRLPGGERAIREPRRTALGVLYEIFGDRAFEREDLASVKTFSSSERSLLRQMLAKGVNSPVTSSAGRLFDGVASLLGLCQRSRFEGQGAMELEFAIGDERTDEAYPFRIADCELRIEEPTDYSPQSKIQNPKSKIEVDWEPTIHGVLAALERGATAAEIAAKFHNTLVEVIVEVAKRVGEERVVLTGGCFQNQYLSEKVIYRLEAEGFRPYWHQRVPPNDGGIALGQAFAWAQAHRQAALMEDSESCPSRWSQAGGAV